LVQLFYSQAFYNQTVMAKTPEDLYDFTITWMDAYYQMAKDATTDLSILLGCAEQALDAINALEDAFADPNNATTTNEEEVENKQSAVDCTKALLRQDFENWPDLSVLTALNITIPRDIEVDGIILLSQFYDLFRATNASWGVFVEEMLSYAAEAYGHEGGSFTSTVADSEARLGALKNTDMLIQATLAPASKVRMTSENEEWNAAVAEFGVEE